MKLCLGVCASFEMEARAVLQAPEFSSLRLRTYEAACGWCPEDSALPFPEAALLPEDGSDLGFLGFCFWIGKRPLPPFVDPALVNRVDHCLFLFAPREVIEGFLSQGCYLMTPGWLMNWRQRIERWGFDQETARAFFRETTSRLVVLDTGVNEGCDRELREFSRFLDLPGERVFVGLDYFRLQILEVVSSWRAKKDDSNKTQGLNSKTFQRFA